MDRFLSRFRALTGTRLTYRPVDREFIKNYGNWIITEMNVMRQPVNKNVKTALNFLTLGKFDDLVKKDYDEVYHLFLEITLINPTGQLTMTQKITGAKDSSLKITLEKNQTIEINYYKPREGTDSLPLVIPQGMTLGSLLSNAEKSVSLEEYFRYDPLSTNCQAYIIIVLKANGILQMNPKAQDFIYQDLGTLKAELPSYARKIMKGLTDIAGRADVIINGYGLNRHVFRQKNPSYAW